METDLAERLLPLEGGVNFRDLGGYATHDGRRVKWRRLYRSGTMTLLTPTDFEHLAQREIRTVIDLRTRREQIEEPNHWCREANIAYWCREYDEVFGHLHEMIDRGIADEEEARRVMEGGYRHLPIQQGPAYAELLRRIAAGETPMVFNCSAGKDRTGGAAALVLAMLGVPRETIVADFTLTTRAVDLRKALLRRRSGSGSRQRYSRLPDHVMDALLAAYPGYISAFLDALDADFGSVEDYLAEIGILRPEIEAARAELLE